MKYFLTSILLLTLILNPSLVLANGDLSDDFDDNGINPDNWFIFQKGGITLNEVNNSLEITFRRRAANLFLIQAGYGSDCTLSGDYDIQVDFNLPIWPQNNGVRLGIFTGSSFDTSQGVQRISFGSNDPSGLTGEFYLADTSGTFISTTNNDTSGKLRLKREANTQTAYYFDDGWQPISSPASYTTDDVHLYLVAYSHNIIPFDAFDDQDVKVLFDNLEVTGETVCTSRFAPHP